MRNAKLLEPTMRCFIAAQIPEKIKDHLEKTQSNLRRAGIKATWVKRKAMHLTLVFFRNITPAQAQKTAEILKEVTSSPNPIDLKLTQLGAFPNLDFPKVIWIGLGGETKTLESVNHETRKKLLKEKIPFDPKPFVPHLTLARLRRMKPQQRKQVKKILALRSGIGKLKPEFQITQINLIKSQLTPQGPIYTPLEEINL